MTTGQGGDGGGVARLCAHAMGSRGEVNTAFCLVYLLSPPFAVVRVMASVVQYAVSICTY